MIVLVWKQGKFFISLGSIFADLAPPLHLRVFWPESATAPIHLFHRVPLVLRIRLGCELAFLAGVNGRNQGVVVDVLLGALPNAAGYSETMGNTYITLATFEQSYRLIMGTFDLSLTRIICWIWVRLENIQDDSCQTSYQQIAVWVRAEHTW